MYHNGQMTAYLEKNQVVHNWHPKIQAMKSGGLVGGDADAAPNHTHLGARHPFIPDIQTTAELGLPGLTITSWTGLMVPSATPKDIVARINAEVASVLKQPDTATRARAGLRHRGELGGSRAKLHGSRSRALGQARAGREYQSRLEKQ